MCRGWPEWLAVPAVCACVLSLLIPHPARAQYVNNQCGTVQGGFCTVKPAPVGSGCGCFTPGGRVSGQIIPPAGGFVPQQQVHGLSNVCRTDRGTCQSYPAPIGSECGCFGDPGTVIPR